MVDGTPRARPLRRSRPNSRQASQLRRDFRRRSRTGRALTSKSPCNHPERNPTRSARAAPRTPLGLSRSLFYNPLLVNNRVPHGGASGMRFGRGERTADPRGLGSLRMASPPPQRRAGGSRCPDGHASIVRSHAWRSTTSAVNPQVRRDGAVSKGRHLLAVVVFGCRLRNVAR